MILATLVALSEKLTLLSVSASGESMSRYFSGNTFQNLDQYTQDSCLDLLEDNSDFHNQYLECILSENMNHQEITIEIK